MYTMPVHRTNHYGSVDTPTPTHHGNGMSPQTPGDKPNIVIDSTEAMNNRMTSLFAAMIGQDDELVEDACEKFGDNATERMKATGAWKLSEAYYQETTNPSITIQETPQFKDCYHFLCLETQHVYIVVGEVLKLEYLARGFILCPVTHINIGGSLPRPVMDHRSSGSPPYTEHESSSESPFGPSPDVPSMPPPSEFSSDSSREQPSYTATSAGSPEGSSGNSTSTSTGLQHGQSGNTQLTHVPECPTKPRIPEHLKACFEDNIMIKSGPNKGKQAIPFKLWTTEIFTENIKMKQRLQRYGKVYLYLMLSPPNPQHVNCSLSNLNAEAAQWLPTSPAYQRLPGSSFFKKACLLAASESSTINRPTQVV